MEMTCYINVYNVVGSDLDACDASCLVCHHLFECGDNSWDMVARLRLIECSLQYSLSDRKCFVRLCWLAPCTTVHALSTVCGNGSPSWHAKWWLNCSIRPVLKHGPRSLTHVRVHGWWNLCAQWKWLLRCLHQQPTDRLGEVWAWAYLLGPERWWTMPVKGEVWGNSDGGS